MSLSHSSCKGVSLIEIMVSVALFLTITTLVFISFRSSLGARELRDAKDLVISYAEGARADARGGRAIDGIAPHGFGLLFSQDDIFFSQYIDQNGCGEINVLGTVELPEGVFIKSAFPKGKVEFFSPIGQMMIAPACPFGEICRPPCVMDDLAPEGNILRLELSHRRTQKTVDINFNAISGRIE